MININWAKIWERIERISGMPVQRMANMLFMFAIFVLGVVVAIKDKSNSDLRERLVQCDRVCNERFLKYLLDKDAKEEEERKIRSDNLREKERKLDSASQILDKTYKSLSK